jgi:maleylpyruvate isomerase
VRPDDDIAGCSDAHATLLDALRSLSDDDVRAPSRLPGWTVAHVLTHLARNADSHVRRFAGARRGEVVDQYIGGADGRAAEIEVGATRPARAIVDDLHASIDAFSIACDDLPSDAWPRLSRDVDGKLRSCEELVPRRWKEVEVHHVDLGRGYEPADWPDPFVQRMLPLALASVSERLPPGAPIPTFEGIDARTALAWIYDRVEIPELPQLTPYG